MFDKNSARGSILFVFAILSLTYGLGEWLQHEEIGPNFVRWYLSDFGFPFAFAMTLMMFSNFKPAPAVLIGGLYALAIEFVQFFRGKGDPIDVFVFIFSVSIGLIITHFIGRRNYVSQ